MVKNTQTKAKALLDAHVQFILDEVSGKALKPLIETEIDALLAAAEKLTLNEVVTPSTIKDTVHAYAVELDVQRGIPELVGEIAKTVHAHVVHGRTRLSDLIPDQQFEEMLDKLLEMRELRQAVLHESVENPVYAALASDILYHGIKDYLTQNAMTRNIPGAQSMMKLGKTMMSKATPGLERSIEGGVKKYIHGNIRATLSESEHFLQKLVDTGAIREAALDVWNKLKRVKISVFRDLISDRDVEDFYVIGFEFWRRFRKTEYFSTLANSAVDGFFDKYGDTSLRELLDEVGVDRKMMLAEAMRFAPQVIQTLKKKKLLEPIVRRNLERFYLSGEVEAILAEV